MWASMPLPVRAARPQVLGWLHGDFLWGILAVVRGLQYVLWPRTDNSPPLEVWFLLQGAEPWPLQAAYRSLTFEYVLQTVIFIVPHCTVMFLRYWAYEDQDRVFVAALRQLGSISACEDQEHLAKLADSLQILPAESTWKWLCGFVLAVTRGGGLALGVIALSTVPTLGPVLYGLALGWKRGRSLGYAPAAVLICMSFLPSTLGLPSGRLLATWGMQSILTARCTAKELLFTIITRSNKSQQRALSLQHHARITGFGLGAASVLSIPIVGPLFWFDLVRLAAEEFGSIAVLEKSVFDLGPEAEEFRLGQARRKEEAEHRARERQERQEAKQRERELRERARTLL